VGIADFSKALQSNARLPHSSFTKRMDDFEPIRLAGGFAELAPARAGSTTS